MQFKEDFQQGLLLRRYKRFLADIETKNGPLTIHCPNTGSMKNCQEPGSRVWYTDSGNPKRKYPCTWQVVESQQGSKIGINTGLANSLVKEAIENGTIAELQGYPLIRSEVPYGAQKSRIDLFLQSETNKRIDSCYVEVKNVSLGMGSGLGRFPDAVTTRGQKHLQELMEVTRQGARSVLLFCVQHEGIDFVKPADEIDPEYGRLLRQAHAAGVELLAYRAKFEVDCSSIRLTQAIPVELE